MADTGDELDDELLDDDDDEEEAVSDVAGLGFTESPNILAPATAPLPAAAAATRLLPGNCFGGGSGGGESAATTESWTSE